MRFNKLIALAGAGSLVIMASLVPVKGEAQIARRVAAVRDGKVRMSFASRDDLCGWGNGISTNGRGWNSGRSSDRVTDDVVYAGDCNEGPARVVFTMRAGEVSKIKTYIGGQWKSLGSGDVDLGTVSDREAVDYLFSLANDGVRDAVFPTTLADSVDVTKRLYELGRDDSKNREARDQAVFWLSQQEDDAAVGYLENILKNASSSDIRDKAIFGLSQHRSGKGFAILRNYAEDNNAPDGLREKAIFWLGQRQGDDSNYLSGLYDRLESRNLKEKVIFGLSQRRDARSMDKLMSIARTDPDREMRKKAMFWLGQSRDPRVSSFLADIISK